MDWMTSIDVALGLIVVYLTFALALTAFNEGIAAVLESRAGWLRRGLEGLLADGGAGSGAKNAESFYASPFVGLMGLKRPPSYLDAWTVVQGALSTLGTQKTRVFGSLAAVQQAVAGLPADMPLRVALEDLCARAEGDLGRFRADLETWFDGFEQQVIGWYRRKTQFVLGGLAVLVAVGFNVDTLALVNQLSHDPAVRKAMAEVAIDASKAAPPKPAASAASAAEPAAAASAASAAAPASPASAAEEARRRIEILRATGLELGWTGPRWEAAARDGGTQLAKLAGLLLSALAISLGAPFWFDILKKVVSVRAVGLNLQEQDDKKQKGKAAGGG